MTFSIIPFSKIISFMLQYLYPLIGTANATLDFGRKDIPVSELTNLLFYWIICGVIFMIENIVGIVTKIPFYYDLKIMALLWLILPVFSGSGYIYYMYIHELINNSLESHFSKVSHKLQTFKSSLLEFSNSPKARKSYKSRKFFKR
ncbi:TB2/DP1, HVA22 family protein [Cryptosporidium meleagridis]|uniref:TB2/DP1, HVA22 family protein n=1 Tax=Cryptosporidium meleagridis TaxID=93969 RepID=A0A2P4YWD6_9CRYT|nr:TB2/DP1, HVA22 family protein [Cryptosporidium meleagridis]